MGVKDQGLQEYLRDNGRFAELVNGTLFGGKQIIKASYLKEVQRKKRVSCQLQTIGSNTHKIKSSDENGVKFIYLERERDFLRLHDKPGCRVLLACEAESRANYEMPVRCFTYDGVEYTDQLKSRKRNRKRGKHRKRRPLVPVFHQVLYLGEERWQSKKKLQEMMEIPEEVGEFSSLLPEYDICMADIHEQNPQLFHTEWRDIFSLMSHSRKKEELKKYIEDNKIEIQKLSLETRWFLAILLEQYTIVDDDVVEVRDVCKAWDGAMQMYADEAREATRKEMKKEMRKRENEKSRRQVFRMFSKGYPQTEIADVLEIPLKTVKRWCAGLTPATEK